MIIVKLQGGLGNQMFQYAVGRHLSYINSDVLKLDVTSFKDDSKRNYSLDCFGFLQDFATKKEIGWFKKYQRKPGKLWFLYNRLFEDKTKYIQERQFHFDSHILKLKPPVYLDGYWNTEKYFRDIRDIILKDFQIKNPLSGKNKEVSEKITHVNSVSIHVRRGDYANDPKTNIVHGTLGNEYYNQAFSLIKNNVKNPQLFIFSDDIEWVRKNILLPFPATYVDWNNDKTAFEDLRLMSLCKHHIIANSSFSWWGAWLSENPNKIVIGPSKWFNTKKSSTDTIDVIPDSWIKI
ncbi:MAG: alpha-1,2-fucosyltransferase [Candidatus Roizmanbacteria bacterium]|nr:alpha-1,2-fucosyltransferase [Candidatus Roizmanbacteria bacterium]